MALAASAPSCIDSGPILYTTYFEGAWQDGNVPLMGAMDHSVWLGSSVFDGARALRGHLPDLRPHLARVVHSAEILGLRCPLTVARST